MAGLSLLEHLGKQLESLAEIVGADSEAARELLADLLGSTGSHLLSEPPVWPSDVSDDHTPVEFSIAFNEEERPTLRVLGEALGARPSAATNVWAAHSFLRTQAARFNLSMTQFDRVRDLFATQSPEGGFELLDPGRKRRLGDATTIGRTTEVLLARERHQIFKLIDHAAFPRGFLSVRI